MKPMRKFLSYESYTNFSQEEMAEKAEMPPSGYAKIERGETRLTLEHLEQFAEIFNVDLGNLIQSDSFFYQVHTNNTNSHNNNSSTEIEKLQLTLAHKNEIIAKLEEQIQNLRALNEALRQQQ